MSRTSLLGTVKYEAESAWAEDVTTTATRLAVLGPPDLSGLTWARSPGGRATQYMNEHTPDILGTQGGSFRTRHLLTGHGSSTAGATSLNALATLLGVVFGNAAVVAASGTTANGAGGDADSITSTASGTFTPGGIFPLGVLGDGDGNGQWAAVLTHTGTALELATAMDGAVANGAVIYSADNAYFTESPTASVTSTRWRLFTANQQVLCQGCWPMSIEVANLGPGGIPEATITWGVSRWTEIADTFPDTTAVETFTPHPVSAGSLFFQAYGTKTRATISVRDFRLTIDLGISPKMGPGGISAPQVIVGAVRGKSMVSFEFAEDAQTASTSPTRPDQHESNTQYYHCMYSLNGAATGQRTGFYFRNCRFADARPTQSAENDYNVFRTRMVAEADTTGSSEILRSAMVIGLG